MEYLRIENDFPRISHSAVTLGKFDGIHRGHQKLVEKIIVAETGRCTGGCTCALETDLKNNSYTKEERMSY